METDERYEGMFSDKDLYEDCDGVFVEIDGDNSLQRPTKTPCGFAINADGDCIYHGKCVSVPELLKFVFDTNNVIVHDAHAYMSSNESAKILCEAHARKLQHEQSELLSQILSFAGFDDFMSKCLAREFCGSSCIDTPQVFRFIESAHVCIADPKM